MILIINICKEKLHYYEFVKPIEDILEKNHIEYLTQHYSNLTLNNIKKADKIIICGTSLKDNDFINYISRFEFIKEYKKPILGICGGMHILSLIFKGKLRKAKEIGMAKIRFKREFLGFNGEKEVYSLHGLYATSNEFDDYAVSGKCVQAIKHKKRPIYAVLFHPEVRHHSVITAFCTAL